MKRKQYRLTIAMTVAGETYNISHTVTAKTADEASEKIVTQYLHRYGVLIPWQSPYDDARTYYSRKNMEKITNDDTIPLDQIDFGPEDTGAIRLDQID
jgi:hypothetical protein